MTVESVTPAVISESPIVDEFLANLLAYLDQTYAEVEASEDVVPVEERVVWTYTSPQRAEMEEALRHVMAARQAERNGDRETMNAEMQAFLLGLKQHLRSLEDMP